MTRLVGSLLVLGLLSGCASFLKMDDEITLSGQGVLASYDQSSGDLTDTKRVGISASKQQIKPVEIANSRLRLGKEFSDLEGLTMQRQKQEVRHSTGTFLLIVR